MLGGHGNRWRPMKRVGGETVDGNQWRPGETDESDRVKPVKVIGENGESDRWRPVKTVKVTGDGDWWWPVNGTTVPWSLHP